LGFQAATNLSPLLCHAHLDFIAQRLPFFCARYNFRPSLLFPSKGPEGMDDCTHLPQITEALMRKGYSDDDIRKILGDNLLRVMEANERGSREMRSQAAAAD